MSLLDYFTYEGRLKRHARRAANRDLQAEDREASIQWLSKDGSPKAIVALLSRFDVNLSSQLKDMAEKEQLLQILLHHKDVLSEPLRHWLAQCKQLAFPMRLLENTEGSAAAIQMAFDLLDAEAKKSAFHPEKKHSLLVWLAERKHAGALRCSVQFLEDFDENVRYAAAEVAIYQETDDAREPLLAALARPAEDSNRVRHRICEAFRARRWMIGDVDLRGRLPGGFAVQEGRIVAV